MPSPTRCPGGRVLIGAGTGSFGRAAARGATEAAAARGLGPRRGGHPRRGARRASTPTSCCWPGPSTRTSPSSGVSGAVPGWWRRWRAACGSSPTRSAPGGPKGVLAPSQWEEGLRLRPDVGPRSRRRPADPAVPVGPGLAPGTAGGHVEYPAAQAYAAVVIALRCVAGNRRLRRRRAPGRRPRPALHDVLRPLRPRPRRPPGRPLPRRRPMAERRQVHRRPPGRRGTVGGVLLVKTAAVE